MQIRGYQFVNERKGEQRRQPLGLCQFELAGIIHHQYICLSLLGHLHALSTLHPSLMHFSLHFLYSLLLPGID